jgi:hypothetical protein
VGYCTLDNLPGFRLDPPRGKTFRVALVLINKVHEQEGFAIHKLEYIEPDRVSDAIACVRKLRKLCKQIRSGSAEKRSHTGDFESCSMQPTATKQARTLHETPTDATLPDEQQ